MHHRNPLRRSFLALSCSIAIVVLSFGISTGCAPGVAETGGEDASAASAEQALAGRLWIALDRTPGALLSFSQEQLGGRSPFTPLSQTAGPALAGPSDLAFDRDGNLWVTNFDNETVTKFDPASLIAGNATPAVVLSGEALQGGPAALAFDRAGTLWVGTYGDRILAYSLAAQRVSGSPEPSMILVRNYRFGLPKEMAFDPAGNLWTVHTNDTRLTMLAASQLAGDPAEREVQPSVVIDSLVSPDALAFDRAGNLWVADYDYDPNEPRSGRIVRFDAATIGDSESADPATVVVDRYGMSDIAFDADGSLWVLQSGDNALLQFTSRQLTGSNVTEPAGRFVFAGGEFDQSGLAFGP